MDIEGTDQNIPAGPAPTASFGPPAAAVPPVPPAAPFASVAAPTAPLPLVAPSVVAPVAGGRPKGKPLPWVLAAVAAVAAVVFAILWIGKSGDADDLAKTRDELQGQVASEQADLDKTNDELGKTKSSLEKTSSDKTSLEGQVSSLNKQIDDLRTQVKNVVKASALAPGASLAFGHAISSEAKPALNDTEAACLGSTTIDRIGWDLFYDVVAGDEEPTDAKLALFGSATLQSARDCNITVTRLVGG